MVTCALWQYTRMSIEWTKTLSGQTCWWSSAAALETPAKNAASRRLPLLQWSCRRGKAPGKDTTISTESHARKQPPTK